MIRENLCKALKDFKIQYAMSYTDLQQTTGLSRSQLHNIINCKGEGVKVERIEEAITYCGGNITMEVTF